MLGDRSVSSQTLVRVLAIVALIGAFIVTDQIERGDVDALVWMGLIVGAVAGLFVVVQAYRDRSSGDVTADQIGQAGAFIAAVLVSFGILRTVVPGVTREYTDAVLGVGMILLLMVIFWITRGRRSFGAAKAGRASSNGSGEDPNGGASRRGNTPANPPGQAASEPVAAGGSSIGLRPLTVLGSVVGIGVLVGYAAVIYGLWQRAGAADDEWARLIGIQSGLEAAAFAALGGLLGFAIQGRAVAAAEDRADAAQGEAMEKATDAAVARQEAETAEQKATDASGMLVEVKDEVTGIQQSLAREAVPNEIRMLLTDENLANLAAPTRVELQRSAYRTDSTDAVLKRLDDLRKKVEKAI